MNLKNKNYYTYIKNKTTPIVFIHGVGLDRNMWTPQINFFRKYSTLTYDLLGHGKTPFNKDKIIIEDYTHQLISLIEDLTISKLHLVGFSIGSLTCVVLYSSKIIPSTTL